MSEALGLALPGNATPPAVDGRRAQAVFETGRAVTRAISEDLSPREILTYEPFRDGVSLLQAIGGSTNAIMHFLALAKESGVRLTVDDFERLRKRVPHIADLRPSSDNVMYGS